MWCSLAERARARLSEPGIGGVRLAETLPGR